METAAQGPWWHIRLTHQEGSPLSSRLLKVRCFGSSLAPRSRREREKEKEREGLTQVTSSLRGSLRPRAVRYFPTAATVFHEFSLYTRYIYTSKYGRLLFLLLLLTGTLPPFLFYILRRGAYGTERDAIISRWLNHHPVFIIFGSGECACVYGLLISGNRSWLWSLVAMRQPPQHNRNQQYRENE